MNRYSLPQDAIDFMLAAGYRVYMRDRADSYALFASPEGIGYVQWAPMAGYTVCTVHYPNRESGTGYQVAREAPALNDRILDDAIRISVPHWARGHSQPRKYASIDEYRARAAWNAEYREIVE